MLRTSLGALKSIGLSGEPDVARGHPRDGVLDVNPERVVVLNQEGDAHLGVAHDRHVAGSLKGARHQVLTGPDPAGSNVARDIRQGDGSGETDDPDHDQHLDQGEAARSALVSEVGIRS